MTFPLSPCTLSEAGLAREPIDRLCQLITGHIAEGRYPGAQIAIARHGQLAVFRTFGDARIAPARTPAADDTLWLLYSNTKVLTACAVWLLVERGALRFGDTIAAHVPGFAQHGKGDITVVQLLTHQAGFPNADVPREAWDDHDLLRRSVCDFALEWAPGSRVHYHSRAAHWTAAVLIEALAKTDYREFIRANVVAPLGLSGELFVGMPEVEGKRAADMHEPAPERAEDGPERAEDGPERAEDGPERAEDGPAGRGHTPLADANTPDFRRAGSPAGGGYGTARAMAAFYQMMANGGTLGAVRLLSTRMVEFVTRNFTADRVDGYNGIPMHRGLGPHLRGLTETIRGLGTLGHPRTFGHGGVGSSYCWADPESGVSFAYVSNSRIPDPWHSERLDLLSNCVHASINP